MKLTRVLHAGEPETGYNYSDRGLQLGKTEGRQLEGSTSKCKLGTIRQPWMSKN